MSHTKRIIFGAAASFLASVVLGFTVGALLGFLYIMLRVG